MPWKLAGAVRDPEGLEPGPTGPGAWPRRLRGERKRVVDALGAGAREGSRVDRAVADHEGVPAVLAHQHEGLAQVSGGVSCRRLAPVDDACQFAIVREDVAGVK